MKQLLLCAGTILVVSLLRGVSTDFSYSSQAVYPAVTEMCGGWYLYAISGSSFLINSDCPIACLRIIFTSDGNGISATASISCNVGTHEKKTIGSLKYDMNTGNAILQTNDKQNVGCFLMGDAENAFVYVNSIGDLMCLCRDQVPSKTVQNSVAQKIVAANLTTTNIKFHTEVCVGQPQEL